MYIEPYLKRIGYPQRPDPDLATLYDLTSAHLGAIAFENLDQQMGVTVSTDPDRVFAKVVTGARGGWCFELNGLFGWLLTELGYDVSVLAGFVGPERPRPGSIGDHMMLVVDCDGPVLVDVGFGGGSFEPLPLRPVTRAQPPYTVSISEQGDGWYKYSELVAGNAGGYWFTLDKVDPGYFAPSNHRLQSDPESPFRRTLTAQRRFPDRHIVLRGLVLKTFDNTGMTQEILADENGLVACLGDVFDLDVPQIRDCWPNLKQRHDDVFGH